MLIITLGTQASGSTWLFNVVRALLEQAGIAFHGGSTDDGLGVLDQMSEAGAAVFKAHSLDQRFIRLARLADARLIVTTRDPRDSVVSQRERFGASLRWTVADLSKTYTTLAMLPDALAQLRLDYEDGFTERIDTVRRIADFLGVAVTDEQAAALSGLFRRDAVKARIAGGEAGNCRDPIHMWHPNHVGDGRVGKWRDSLDDASDAAVTGALGPLMRGDAWRREPIRWSDRLFQYGDGDDGRPAPAELDGGGAGRCLAHGPYLFLPSGYWRVVVRVRSANRLRHVRLRTDVYLPYLGEAPVVAAAASLPPGSGRELAMVFRHSDHFQRIEVRLHAVAGSRGRVRFDGCELQWLGPIEAE